MRDNNSGLPEGTKIDVGDNGDTTITYPDTSVDTIPGNKLVEEKNSAENLDPTVPDKTKVDDPTKLTDDEKKEVEDNIRDNNSGLPEGTKIDVGDNGDTTITYPDTSVDTISGDKLVEEKTSADKLDPTVPAKTKVEVKDPNNLTDEEKQQVKESIENANKDQFPEGTQVTIGNDGTATITYPDGSQDVIPGSQLVTKQGSDVANTGDVKSNGQGTTASIQGATADTTAKKLPQTGEQNTSATAATGLGLIILSLLGLFGLGSKKRKED
ncbi:LPXTG cell wall anchor domain-containing protein [Ligilactobacillus sp. UO.C109]|nr:LPXTG cell wall anchor domain-containing protein [Ligilactobacillus sp. UO.C109]